MTIKFDEIEETLNKMTEGQLRLTLAMIAVRILNVEVVDKFDYVEAVKTGLSWPLKDE